MSTPKIPPMPPAPPGAPTQMDPAVVAAAMRERRRRAMSFGRQGTILTGGQGAPAYLSSLGSQALLGGSGAA